jgi:hypothetical protein
MPAHVILVAEQGYVGQGVSVVALAPQVRHVRLVWRCLVCIQRHSPTAILAYASELQEAGDAQGLKIFAC